MAQGVGSWVRGGTQAQDDDWITKIRHQLALLHILGNNFSHSNISNIQQNLVDLLFSTHTEPIQFRHI